MKKRLGKDRIRKLAAKHGTGKYLFSASQLEGNIREIRRAFSSFPGFTLAYSAKANYSPGVIEFARRRSLFFDAASIVELDHLLRAGVAPGKIWISTPYLTDELLAKCVSQNIQINADSVEQVGRIAKLAKSKEIPLGVRFNFPELEASRFGVEASERELDELEKVLRSAPHLKLKMLHAHFSGADRSAASLKKRAKALVALYKKHFKDSEVHMLNVGGGMSGAMDAALAKQFSHKLPSWMEYAQALNVLSSEFKKYRLTLAIEPGMALVADTFYFLAEVVGVKTVGKKQIALLNSSRLFLKPTGHGKSLSFDVIGKKRGGSRKQYELVGMTCMENDVVGNYEGVLHPGDLIVFKNVGAYTLSCRPDFIFNEPEIVTFKNES